MKNKNGFTLVELLGVVVILGIVFGLAVVTYRSTRSDINRSYYNTLEEGLLIPGGDYFNYNKGEGPGIFGDTAKVKIKDLEDEGYLDTEVVDSDGNPCDLENSYVGAYKDSIDKTNYYVCLVCGSYKTDNIACDDDRQRVDYSLGVRANKKDSKDVYDINGNSWSNEDIVLTFETLNEMDTVILENESGSETGRCNLTSKNNNIKSCTITITKSGNYKAYAKNNSNNATTRKQDIKILIDKENPTFDVLDQGVLQDGKKTIEVEIEAGITAVEKEITNQVNNIKDTGGSGIKSVEYTLEFDEDKDYYKEQGKVSTFNIKKTLKLGLHHLKIRVTDNAGNKTEENIEYVVYKLIVFPTKSLYCKDLTYNSYEQVLVKNPGEGYDFKRNGYSNTNIKEIYANNYNITIVLKDNYRFSKNDVEDKTLTCEIKKKSLTITARAQTMTYGDDFDSGDTKKITTSGLQGTDYVSSIKLTRSTIHVTTSGTITPSNAKIIRSANNYDVTDSYNITYKTGYLAIERQRSATTGTCNDVMYDETSKTLASGAVHAAYQNNTATEIGFYEVTVNAYSDYAFSDGSITATLDCILKPTTFPTISFSKDGDEYGSGYKSGLKVTVKCEDIYGVSTFIVNDTVVNGTSKTVKLTKKGDQTVKASCTSIYQNETTDSKKYKIYVSYDCSTYKTVYSGEIKCYNYAGFQSVYPCSSTVTSTAYCTDKNFVSGEGTCSSKSVLDEAKTCWTAS